MVLVLQESHSSSFLRLLLLLSPSRPCMVAALCFLLRSLLPPFSFSFYGCWSSLSTSQDRWLLLFSSLTIAGDCCKCSSPSAPSTVILLQVFFSPKIPGNIVFAADFETCLHLVLLRHLQAPSRMLNQVIQLRKGKSIIAVIRAMALGRLASWARDVPHRLTNIPWHAISSEAFDRCFFIVKVACGVHVTNKYLLSVAYVMGPSMLPTLNLSGDVVLLDKLSPRLGKIGVGDVVVFQSPENPRKTVTKRVLGIEGDKVTFLVDPTHGDRSKTVVVPKGYIWVQGDNIYASRDSRRFGAIPHGLVLGRAFFRVWPPEGFGSLKQE